MGKSVRRPRVDLDARGRIETHGTHDVDRGVWHSTECGDVPGVRELEGVVSYWEKQGRGYGAQVIIDKDGNSALCANPHEICWAVENHNTGTFSIELVGFARFTPRIWFARHAQLDKLARWMAWLNLEYGVPLRESPSYGWSTHALQSATYGGTHTDPGRGFPKRYVLRLARKYRKEGWA